MTVVGNEITNVTYTWLSNNSAGTIDSTGKFTAGSTTGVYTNLVGVIAIQGDIARVVYASVTISDIATLENYVTITPSSATIVKGGNQQFTAQAFDGTNTAVAVSPYDWSASGTGEISSTGLFTASTAGTYTVQATVPGTGIYGNANIVVTETTTTTTSTTTTTTTSPPPAKQGVFPGFCYGSANFTNFLGGQYQYKDGNTTHTVQVTPGVVQSVSANTLIILPNGQSTAVTYTISSDTRIMPKKTQLAANDKVIVISDNGQVNSVIKVAAAANQVPPGQENKDRTGKQTPPGWSQGKKVGWGNFMGFFNHR